MSRKRKHKGDPFEDVRKLYDPEFKGLPHIVNVRAIAEKERIQFHRVPSANRATFEGDRVQIPSFYTMRDANVEIAKAIVEKREHELPPVEFDDGTDVKTAWATVLCLPREEFEIFSGRSDIEDQPLANIFDVPKYFLDIRKKMLDHGY